MCVEGLLIRSATDLIVQDGVQELVKDGVKDGVQDVVQDGSCARCCARWCAKEERSMIMKHRSPACWPVENGMA